MADRDEEVRHLRELLARLATAVREHLSDIEHMDAIKDDAEFRVEWRRVMARRKPELRLVTDNLGDSHPGRGGGSGSA